MAEQKKKFDAKKIQNKSEGKKPIRKNDKEIKEKRNVTQEKQTKKAHDWIYQFPKITFIVFQHSFITKQHSSV